MPVEKIYLTDSTAQIMRGAGVEVRVERKFYILGEKTKSKRDPTKKRSPIDKLKLTPGAGSIAKELQSLIRIPGLWTVELMQTRPILGSAQLSHLMAKNYGITQASASYRIGELIRFKVLEII